MFWINWFGFNLLVCVIRISGEVCQFHLSGDNKLFEKVPEDLAIGSEIAKVRVFPRDYFAIEATDNPEDIKYVRHVDIDDKTVALLVEQSLEDLVDNPQPKSVLKFKLACKGNNSTEAVHLPVNIYIQDINDHSPTFQNAPYFVEVDELTPVGLTIFKGIHATDGDKPNTANSEVSYSIVGGNGGDTFILSDPMEGNVVVAKPLDFDHGVREYKLDIQVQDHGSPVSHSSVTTLTIKVKDSDDQNPMFTSDVYRVKVNEKWQMTGQPLHERLAVEPTIHAEDLDKAINATVRYSIIAGNEMDFFSLDPKDASLYLLKEVDREQLLENLFVLQIQAAQEDNPIRLAKTRVEIEIVDLNDNLPIFEADLYNVSIMENLPLGFSVAQVRAIDEDQGENAMFRFQLEDPSGAFQIDEVTGWITVKNQSRLDREKDSHLALKVFAIEKARSVLGNSEPSSAQVEVHLIDANDNDPVFVPSSVYRFNVSETAEPGLIIGTVHAQDMDQGENGRVFYFRHVGGSSDSHDVPPFDVHRENGSVYVVQSPAKTTRKPGEFILFIGAGDKPNDPVERRTSLAIVYIDAADENNNPPSFLGMPLGAYIGENLPSGTVVTTIMAKDPDSMSTLRFAMNNNNGSLPFVINPTTGVITTTNTLDFESRDKFELAVEVTDGDFIVSAPLSIHVIDVNDHIPQFDQTRYQFSVLEEEEPGLIIGTVKAFDGEKGQNGEIQYKLTDVGENPAFAITDNGTIYTVRPIDREREETFNITVVASDQGVPPLTGTASVYVTIEDINDNPPQFAVPVAVTMIQEEMVPPVSVIRVSASDVDIGDNAKVMYYIVSGNEDGLFLANETTGEIVAQGSLDYERKTRHVLNVSAVDRNDLDKHDSSRQDSSKGFIQVIVNVEDRHDSPPTFERDSYIFVIPENHKPFEVAAVVNAYNTSSDYEQKIVYWMAAETSPKLRLDTDSGEVVLTEPIDRDPPNNEISFKIQILARDLLSISKSNSSTNVTILVSDINDNSPKFEQDFYQVQIPEDTPVGSNLPIVFSATDPDEGDNGQVAFFRFNQSHPKFSMSNSSSVVTLIEPLDYEDENRYTFEIQAVDKGDPPRTGTATLVVNILNINESPPVFSAESYEFFVGENVGSGTQVGQVFAKDADGNSVLYSLSRGDLDFFDIDESSGKIYTKSDTSGRSLYGLTAMAIDDGQPRPLSSTVEVVVHVKEANNHPPVFQQPVYEASVPEKDATGEVIVQMVAKDEDPLNNNVTYSIAEGNEDAVFMIDVITGEIRVNPQHIQDLDYDVRNSYTLVVEAKDSHERPRIGVAMAQISVEDTNDHPPKFTQSSYHSAVRENIPEILCFVQVRADSGDSVDQVRYSLVGQPHSFVVDGTSGQVCVVKPLDRESQAQYTLTVKATDSRFNSFATVNVEVVDENDNSPKFDRDRYEVTIPHDARPGSEVVTVKAVDPDTAYNGQVTYWTTNNYGLFELDYKTGSVRLLQNLLLNKNSSTGDRIYVLDLFAQDHGMDPKTGKAQLMVRVSAAGGHKPEFERFIYEVALPEQEENLTVVRVRAVDPDEGDETRVRYRIRREVKVGGTSGEETGNELFSVDPVTGEVSLQGPLDFSDSQFHQVEVQAFDDGEELTSSSSIVQVKVLNTNNHPPQFYPIPSMLRIPMSTAIGQSVFRVQATDKDNPEGSSHNILYQFTAPHNIFSLNPVTGDLVVGQKLLPLARNLSIIASDQGTPPLENEIVLMLEVYDEKSPRMQSFPVFATNQVFREYTEALNPGTPIARVTAETASAEPVGYNITDGIGFQEFGIDPDTGIIYTKKHLSRGLYHLLVSAHNKLIPAAFSEAIITVHSIAPSETCPTFIFPEFRASVSENAPEGHVVMNDLQVQAPETFHQLQYKIESDPSSGAFGLQTKGDNTAHVILLEEIDREKMAPELQGVYSLVVSVSDDNCTRNATLKVFVEDVNDNAPEFSLPEYITTVKENSAEGTLVLTLSATDVDDVDNGKLVFNIAEGNDDGHFSLNGRTGTLSVKAPCDREVTSAFELVLQVRDTSQHSSSVRVLIEVLDENDEIPKFENESYILVTKEGTESLKASLVLEAGDDDIGMNSQLEFAIIKGNEDGEFQMATTANKGVLSVAQELDRDAYETDASAIRFLVVSVKDKGNPPLSSTTMVTVVIEDINDLAPDFEHDTYHELISEGVVIGHNITQVKAVDRDSQDNTHLIYTMQSVTPGEELPFVIDSTSGLLTVTKLLDFAERNEYNISLFVSDGLHTTMANLKIYVSEAIDRQPRMDQSQYDFRVEENKAGEKIGQVIVGRPRDSLRRPIDFKIVNTEAQEFFAISNDGTLFTKVALDRETREVYSFAVVQEDQKLTGRKDVCQVNIIVEDVNDEAPTFPRSYTGTIEENCQPGTPVNITPGILAIDKDAGLNSVFQYSLSGDGSDLFEIDSLQGSVGFSQSANVTLDREQIPQYNLKVTATDLFNLSSSTDLKILVLDVNDHSPTFTHGDQSVEILETTLVGTKMAQLVATDLDGPGPNSKLVYAIVSGDDGKFRVDKETGEIYLSGSVTPETTFSLNTSATDGGDRKSFAQVHVHVLDVNNHAPQFPRTDFRFTIPEGRYTIRPLTLGQLAAADEDYGNNAAIEYKLDSVTDEGWPFEIDTSSGHLNITRDLDRETQTSYNFVVVATDQGVPQLSSTASISVSVLDVNDEQPRFIGDPYYASIPENQKPGYFVSQVRAYDLDSNATGNGRIVYKLDDEQKHNFFIDSRDGTIWTLKSLDYEHEKSYTILVTASDQGEPPLSATATVYVNVTDKDDVIPNFRKSVFMVEVAENAPPGAIVYKLDAGSPKFRYSLIEEELSDTFSLDESTGEISLLRHLDSERQSVYRAVVQATDMNDNNNNNDTAEIILLVATGPALRTFARREYLVKVRENLPSPLIVLDLNATDETETRTLIYEIIGNDHNGLFTIDSKSGQLTLTRSLDREEREEFVVRVRGRKLDSQSQQFMESVPSKSSDLAADETLVKISVEDENDNVPEFGTRGRPLVTVAPVEASFGYNVVTVKATDLDSGLNGAVRYELVQKQHEEEVSNRFQIHPVTGDIRSLTPLAMDAGKVFGLDIKAADKNGAPDGHSAYLNVMIYVVVDNKFVVLSLGEKPLLVEENVVEIARQLSNATGYEVKIHKMEPHREEQQVDRASTDLFLYAVDWTTNTIVDTDRFMQSLNEKHEILERDLSPYKIGQVQSLSFHSKSSQLSVTEVALLAFGILVFIAAAIGVFLACLRRRNKKPPMMTSSKLSSPLWATDDGKMKESLTGRVSRNNSLDKGNNYSSTIHSNPDYTTEMGTPRDSYKDSLSSVSTLDLQKSRRNRQRAPSSSSARSPPLEQEKQMETDWPEEEETAPDYPVGDAPERNWWSNKASSESGIWISMNRNGRHSYSTDT